MKISAKSILNHYFDTVEILKIEQLNTGLINQTFDIDTNLGRFILQKINKGVFKNWTSLMQNKISVTEFLRKSGFPVASIIKTIKGDYQVEEQDEIWHLSEYIVSCTKERMNAKTASESGKLIASFHKALLNFPMSEIRETIPDFHNVIKRYDDLKACIQRTEKEKLFETKQEIDFLERYSDFISPLARLINNGEIPIRIVHNDTKLTNILFDSLDNAICLIDFDTIMCGTIFNDVGDAMRSGSNDGDENEQDLNLVHFNREIYETFIESYLQEANSFLTEIEKENIHFALPLILFEQACRFLADYYNGDVYYPVDHSKHNLIRARTQIKLLEEVIRYRIEKFRNNF
jgi:N-acetylhexosamine 1-kinase